MNNTKLNEYKWVDSTIFMLLGNIKVSYFSTQGINRILFEFDEANLHAILEVNELSPTVVYDYFTLNQRYCLIDGRYKIEYEDALVSEEEFLHSTPYKSASVLRKNVTDTVKDILIHVITDNTLSLDRFIKSGEVGSVEKTITDVCHFKPMLSNDNLTKIIK